MSRLNELVISGITASDVDELSKVLDDNSIEVYRRQVKSHSAVELVEVIFNDYNSVDFVRDMILGKAFDLAFSKLKLAIQYLINKGKKVDTVGVEKDFRTKEGKAFTISVLTNPNQLEVVFERVNSIPEEALTPTSEDTTVTILIDKDGAITITMI